MSPPLDGLYKEVLGLGRSNIATLVLYGQSFGTQIMQASHCANVDPQRTHKYIPLAAPSGICWHTKDFVMSPKVDLDTGETQLGSFDGLQFGHESPDDFTMFYNILTVNSEH